MLQHFCQWLFDSSVGTGIRESVYLFPIIDAIHVLGMALLVGTIAILDLRLLGVVLKTEPVSQVAKQILPLTWCGFGVMFISGFLLFWAEAAKSYGNPAFRIKLLLLLLVGLNPLIFHSTIYRSVKEWNRAEITPLRARLTAVLSLVLWGGIVAAGRSIAYFQK